jgi:hypothetical protein
MAMGAVASVGVEADGVCSSGFGASSMVTNFRSGFWRMIMKEPKGYKPCGGWFGWFGVADG